MTMKTFVCVLCGATVKQWGNNPQPLASERYRCCDDCNKRRVIPARIAAAAA